MASNYLTTLIASFIISMLVWGVIMIAFMYATGLNKADAGVGFIIGIVFGMSAIATGYIVTDKLTNHA